MASARNFNRSTKRASVSDLVRARAAACDEALALPLDLAAGRGAARASSTPDESPSAAAWRDLVATARGGTGTRRGSDRRGRDGALASACSCSGAG